MRRKIKPLDPNELYELFDADDINRTSIKGEMRKLYSAIHQKLTEGGWSARDIVTWMDERGISMTVELFRVYLNALDREQGYSRSKNALHATSKRTPSATTSSQPQSTVAATSAVPAAPVAAPATGSRRPQKIFTPATGMLSELKPSEPDGLVDLKQQQRRTK